jgi:hypothetical protein
MVSRITDISFGVQAGIQRNPVEINNYFFFTYKILEFALVNFPEYFCLKWKRIMMSAVWQMKKSTIFVAPEQYNLE